MTNPMIELLEEKGVLLADGATGTNLFNMGLMSGDAPELWNTDKPDNIRKLYQTAVDAGSDIFLTNSFGANASRLKLHDAEERVYELSRISAELGREVADASGRKIIVAGSVGPTGEIMEPVGALSHENAAAMFEATAQGLKDGGADICWLETISSREEFAAAADGFARADVDWCGTMSFDTAGRTMMGITSTDFTAFIETLDHPPLAFGANCGVGASDLLRTLRGFSTSARPKIAKANAGIPKYVDGEIIYDGTPELMAEYTKLAYASGARIIGGCCGTLGEHLKRMRDVIDTIEDNGMPSLEEIQQKLGGFSSETDGTEEGCCCTPKRRERRRRRA